MPLHPRPASEFEWEDLLVRVELMLRALRVTLDPVDTEDAAVVGVLAALAAREAEVGELLENAASRHSARILRPSGERRNPGEHVTDPASALDPGFRRDDDVAEARCHPERSEGSAFRLETNPAESLDPRFRGDDADVADALDPGLHRDDESGAGNAALATFLRRRQRNFAVVQRRGLDVWDWTTAMKTGETATVYQLLSHLVEEDVRALAALRAVRPTLGSSC